MSFMPDVDDIWGSVIDAAGIAGIDQTLGFNVPAPPSTEDMEQEAAARAAARAAKAAAKALAKAAAQAPPPAAPVERLELCPDEGYDWATGRNIDTDPPADPTSTDAPAAPAAPTAPTSTDATGASEDSGNRPVSYDSDASDASVDNDDMSDDDHPLGRPVPAIVINAGQPLGPPSKKGKSKASDGKGKEPRAPGSKPGRAAQGGHRCSALKTGQLSKHVQAATKLGDSLVKNFIKLCATRGGRHGAKLIFYDNKVKKEGKANVTVLSTHTDEEFAEMMKPVENPTTIRRIIKNVEGK